MARLRENMFASYILTEEEERQGSVLTSLQLAVIQNLIADCAEQKNSLVLDPNNVVAYAQQEADLAGRIAILTYLKELSAAMQADMHQAPIVIDDDN